MGHWVTLDDDQHVYISDRGEVLASRSEISRGKPAGPKRGPQGESGRSRTAEMVAKARAGKGAAKGEMVTLYRGVKVGALHTEGAAGLSGREGRELDTLVKRGQGTRLTAAESSRMQELQARVGTHKYYADNPQDARKYAGESGAIHRIQVPRSELAKYVDYRSSATTGTTGTNYAIPRETHLAGAEHFDRGAGKWVKSFPANRAQDSGPGGMARPSLREQAAAHRAGKGTVKERALALTENLSRFGAKQSRTALELRRQAASVPIDVRPPRYHNEDDFRRKPAPKIKGKALDRRLAEFARLDKKANTAEAKREWANQKMDALYKRHSLPLMYSEEWRRMKGL